MKQTTEEMPTSICSSSAILRLDTAVPFKISIFSFAARCFSKALGNASIPSLNDSTETPFILSTKSPNSYTPSSFVTPPLNMPNKTLPFPLVSASHKDGNAALTDNSRESAAYIPWTNALPNTRAKLSPNLRVKNESTDSSWSVSAMMGRLALLKGSLRTAGMSVHDNGLDSDQGESRDHRVEGRRSKPPRSGT